MVKKDRDYPKKLIEWWVSFVQRRPFVVIIVTLLATAAVFFYLTHNFRINTDLNSMISGKLHFRKLEEDFSRAFPQLSDTIVVVLDADTPERAVSARKSLAKRLSKESKLFKTIYEPDGGDFFEKNGLLYMSTEDLEDLADKLANAQPLLAFLSQDPSLRGLFSVLGMALSNTEFKEISDRNMNFLFDELSKAFDGVISNHPYQISWETLMLGAKETAEQRRQFIILQPYIDIAKLSTDEASLETIRHIVRELNLNEKTGVKVRITGDVALSYENLMTVKNSTGIATLISLFLVGVVFYIGLGSGRMVIASLLTLIIGLIWTTGFAIAFVGSLNLISITFAVLFIGLGIDYSIQFCLRYRELLWSGYSEFEGIRTTAKGVGRSLLLSCTTVAIGFYSFVPTAYAGVAELGLISGTGMFISFFATVTVLPAFLTLSKIKKGRGFSFRFGKLLSGFQYKYPKTIVVIAVILGLGSIPFLPRVFFDSNPLNLYSKTSESVSTIRELFKNTETQPWTISVLVKGEKNAQKLIEKLETLREVKMAIMLSDFVPEKQSEKLGIISNIALFMPPNIGNISIKHLNYEQEIKALNSFENTLRKSLHSPHMKDNTSAKHLYGSIQHFKGLLTDPVKGKRALTTLEGSLLFNLPDLFKRLETSLQAKPFNESGLPRQLKEQYVSSDGRYRVQVFPSENILNVDALKRFVHAVQALAPNATDAPVTIYESGMAVVSSFKEASLYALIAITIFLLVELRSFSITILILIPLILAMFLTGMASVLLDIPLNFANVIVVPLLLGIGVHSGIIFMLRYLTEPPLDGNMLRTSTARAVFFSTLTIIISTVSLSFSPHRGIASMGMLLTLCLGLLIVCTLVLLPALLVLSGRHFERKKKNKSF
jgi:hopanoid biosynthesis associated RND transporter like protein HpnN